MKNSFNLTKPILNINDNGRRLYHNYFTDLTNFYLVILHININIKLISTSTVILKYLIDEIINLDFLLTYFLVCSISLS